MLARQVVVERSDGRDPLRFNVSRETLKRKRLVRPLEGETFCPNCGGWIVTPVSGKCVHCGHHDCD